MSQPPTEDERLRDRETITTNAGDDDERVSRKVVYEHIATSGSSHSAGITIIVIVVLALVLIGYILMHLHR
ncbi:MAG TPA: hypothetical protein VNN08_16310 [Thermoanaerobaculia bacterium]|nr:hypothetical protein [Thermoanaerobaculia bacterium]